jgi:hypothetical protein
MESPIVNCMNCGKKAPASTFKLCLGVMVCDDCDVIANTVYDRGRVELRSLLTLLQESIRLALMEGRLNFTSDVDPSASKRDILKTIVQLVELRHARGATSGIHGSVGR